MTIKPGAFRFNTDSMKLEIFRGSANYEGTASMAGIGTLAAGQWEEIQATSPEVQTGGTRGMFGGGINYPGTFYDRIEYINLDSTGNGIDFGNLLGSYTWFGSAVGSRTRGIWSGHQVPASPHGAVTTIEYVTIASTGDSQDFGDLVTATVGGCTSGASNSTRGLTAGGDSNGAGSYTDVIQYITMASTGDSVNFGDLTSTKYAISNLASSTRGVFGGEAPGYSTDIEYVTISTLGNSADFGDLSAGASGNGSGSSNSVRGLFYLGITSPAGVNTIEYITISTLGNAQDFGDASVVRYYGASAASSTRSVYAGGANGGAGNDKNEIDYVQIMSTGNSVDFGDLTQSKRALGGLSNGHGGL